MSKSISNLRSAIDAKINAAKTSLGIVSETLDLSSDQSKLDAISAAVDEANETWNENLPSRPTS